MRRIIVVLVALLCAGLLPAAASAQVDDWKDDWRILHIGLQSGASVDTDGDGVVNSWAECRQQGNSKKAHCKKSPLYQKWQTDVGCVESTVEAWTDYQIDVVQESVFLQTTDYVPANPYDMERYEETYGFESYDVVMVWTGYTQALGFDGGTWNGVTGGYSFIALYGLAGSCDGAWPAYVPAHEFVHAVVGLYINQGYPVCPTYDYPYGDYGEWEGHHMILTNTFPPTTCANGTVSTGVPGDAWLSGSWVDYY
jgi:hypothetical protein